MHDILRFEHVVCQRHYVLMSVCLKIRCSGMNARFGGVRVCLTWSFVESVCVMTHAMLAPNAASSPMRLSSITIHLSIANVATKNVATEDKKGRISTANSTSLEAIINSWAELMHESCIMCDDVDRVERRRRHPSTRNSRVEWKGGTF